MNPQFELPESIYDPLKRHCAQGESHFETGHYSEAMGEYNAAWMLIPDPKNEWEASTWVLAALADTCIRLDRLEKAREALLYAMTCPGGLGNPFLHLRLGQVSLDLGDEDRAADELIRAYMAEGEEIFAAEDPKYLSFLASRAQL